MALAESENAAAVVAAPAPELKTKAEAVRVGSPAAFYALNAANVAEDAIAAGFGPGSEKLRGFLDNTAVFELIQGQLW